MVSKKQALKTAALSAVVIGIIVFFGKTYLEPAIVAGLATFIIGYFGMIK